jgi:membrane-bound lytic murein transglycosylase B
LPTAPVRIAAGSETGFISGLDRVHDVAEVQNQGVVFSGRDPPAGLCSIFELPTPGMPSKFVAGFTNFEAVTRYNRSTFYASAVLELGEAIQKARGHVQLALASASEDPLR